MRFLSRLFGLQPKVAPVTPGNTVEFNDLQVTRTMQDGTQEILLWTELQEVNILTTDEGPFVDDVFWALSGPSGGCLVPSETEGMKELLVELQKLPGFNNEAVIQAMGSTSNAKFLCWQREAEL